MSGLVSGRHGHPLVSVFTAACQPGAELESAYRSLLRQTYGEWEWVVVDDSEPSSTADLVAELADSSSARGRVRLYRQYPHSGSIGANKAAAAGLSHGEILVELDHDDELAPEALDLVVAAFAAHPDIDCVFSDFVDWLDAEDGEGTPALYPDGWAFGFGAYASELIDGRRVPVGLSPPITPETIRHIVAAPNHLRAWRTRFYHRIGGHNHRLPVADDYDLVVRTFLEGTMARIPRPLYVQHHSPRGANASRSRNPEIQTLVAEISATYEGDISRRATSLGLTLAPTFGSALTSPEPMAIANALIDPVAEAATDLGKPLVSIVIPTYRRPKLLQRAIETAIGQSYRHLDVVVVGDCCPSVDGVMAGIADDRVRHWNLSRHHGDGGASPRNYALKAMARGTLIAYLDDDNEWRADHVESLVTCLEANPTATFAFSSFEIEGEPIICRRPRRFQIDTSALLHRRFLLERFGYWRASADVDYAHDWELVSRWTGEPGVPSMQPTLRYRLRETAAGQRVLEVIRAVAAEEAQRASPDPREGVATVVGL